MTSSASCFLWQETISIIGVMLNYAHVNTPKPPTLAQSSPVSQLVQLEGPASTQVAQVWSHR